MRPPSSHTTVRTVQYTAVLEQTFRCSSIRSSIDTRPSWSKNFLGKVFIHVTGTGVPPWPSLVECAHGGLVFIQPGFYQAVAPSPVSFPLPPKKTSQFPAYPAVQFLGEGFHLGVDEVIDPSPDFRIQVFPDKPLQVSPSPHTEAVLQVSPSASSLIQRRPSVSHSVPVSRCTPGTSSPMAWPQHFSRGSLSTSTVVPQTWSPRPSPSVPLFSLRT